MPTLLIRTAQKAVKAALFVFFTLLSALPSAAIAPASFAFAQPEYAQWGRLAMQEAHKKYPQAAIVDYLHVGRTTLSPSIAEETFKLLLRQNGREWGVLVHIRFVIKTSQVLSIRFENV